MLRFIENSTRMLFFTGKGGVGKTSLACAVAVALADRGKRVLLVSTDPASNLGQVFGIEVGAHEPTALSDVPGLFILNINPEAAAQAYRDRIVIPRNAASARRRARRLPSSSPFCGRVSAIDTTPRCCSGVWCRFVSLPKTGGAANELRTIMRLSHLAVRMTGLGSSFDLGRVGRFHNPHSQGRQMEKVNYHGN